MGETQDVESRLPAGTGIAPPLFFFSLLPTVGLNVWGRALAHEMPRRHALSRLPQRSMLQLPFNATCLVPSWPWMAAVSSSYLLFLLPLPNHAEIAHPNRKTGVPCPAMPAYIGLNQTSIMVSLLGVGEAPAGNRHPPGHAPAHAVRLKGPHGIMHGLVRLGFFIS